MRPIVFDNSEGNLLIWVVHEKFSWNQTPRYFLFLTSSSTLSSNLNSGDGTEVQDPFTWLMYSKIGTMTKKTRDHWTWTFTINTYTDFLLCSYVVDKRFDKGCQRLLPFCTCKYLLCYHTMFLVCQSWPFICSLGVLLLSKRRLQGLRSLSSLVATKAQLTMGGMFCSLGHFTF